MAAKCSVFLNVHDLEKAREFYQALGFRQDSSSQNEAGETTYVDMSLQGAELSLGWIGGNDDRDYRSWVSTPLGAGVIVYFSVPDVDKVYATAQRAGAVIEAPLRDRSYGRAFNLNDPDGYVVCFITEGKPARKAKAPRAKPAKAKPAARRTTKAKKR